jgi:hypothetical protein
MEYHAGWEGHNLRMTGIHGQLRMLTGPHWTVRAGYDKLVRHNASAASALAKSCNSKRSVPLAGKEKECQYPTTSH